MKQAQNLDPLLLHYEWGAGKKDKGEWGGAALPSDPTLLDGRVLGVPYSGSIQE